MHSSQELVLCHRTADFDALGAAVGIARLFPGARIVLCGGTHPGVKNFLALYRDEFPLIERRSVNTEQIRTIIVVDAQRQESLGPVAEWLSLPQVQVQVWDHHLHTESNINADEVVLEAVGATTTLVVERLMKQATPSQATPSQATPSQATPLSVSDLTVMALGIHVDTGSLTYDHSTARDARALAWLMEQGANQRAIAEYIEPGFSSRLQEILGQVLEQLETVVINGYRLGWVLVETNEYVPGLSSLASQLIVLSESDAIFLGNVYPSSQATRQRMTVIARSRIDGVDISEGLRTMGGGGHAQAAAVALKTQDPDQVLTQLVQIFTAQLPIPPKAIDLMSSPVRTIRPDTTIDQARRILLRYGHSGLSVVDAQDQLVGIISRRDLDIALHHGFGHAPVKGYMTRPVQTIQPETSLPEIETLMVSYDIGRLPVVKAGELVGIVTRTDILRQLHQLKFKTSDPQDASQPQAIQARLEQRIHPTLQHLLLVAAAEAERHHWHLYLVGGAVRDLLLAESQPQKQTQTLSICPFKEFDLVVDGGKSNHLQGAGGILAKALQTVFPHAQLQIYGEFQTASLVWHEDERFGNFSVDIATARSEFYPYPAANPEVAVSSVRQDLYRRDFTINALAIRLTAHQDRLQQRGELLDFFRGIDDLQNRVIRVLHPNSFIEDPTRIFRAIRFAVRLNFSIDAATLAYMETAIASGLYHQNNRILHQGSPDKSSLDKKLQNKKPQNKTPALQSRLRNELKYIFSEAHWLEAIALMGQIQALSCLHRDLQLTPQIIRQIKVAAHWLKILQALQAELADRWLIIVETILTQLPRESRQQVAQRLNLPEKSQERLLHFNESIAKILPKLNHDVSAGQVAQVLQGERTELLILVATSAPIQVRQKLWRYLTDWQFIQPLINGRDLIEMGYQPGQSFRQILASVLEATLDQTIRTPNEAKRFVQALFPLP